MRIEFSIMNIKGALLLACLILCSCSHKKDFDVIIANEWENCSKENNVCTIDLSTLMRFEWDTMCYYSGGLSLDEIESDLGRDLTGFTDIGDRVVFLNKGRIMYHKEWFRQPSKEKEGVYMYTNLNKFKVSKSNAKFHLEKIGKVYALERMDGL